MTFRELYRVNFNWKRTSIVNLHLARRPDDVADFRTMSIDSALAEYSDCDVLYIYKQEVYLYNDC